MKKNGFYKIIEKFFDYRNNLANREFGSMNKSGFCLEYMAAMIDRLSDRKYQITKQFPTGSHTVVYQAIQSDTGKLCNIRIIDMSIHMDIVSLYKMIMQIEHSFVCNIIDTYEYDRWFFVVIKCREGKSLPRILEEHSGSLPEDEIVDYAIQMAEALSHLQHMNPPVVCRMICLSNLFVDDDGKISLIDTGWITRYIDGKGCSDPGHYCDRRYASPEQLVDREDTHSDIFSLGMVMYRLAGVDFEAYPYEWVPIRKVNRTFPRKLEKIIGKCIKIEPKKRYQTADELLGELRMFYNRQKSDKEDKKIELWTESVSGYSGNEFVGIVETAVFYVDEQLVVINGCSSTGNNHTEHIKIPLEFRDKRSVIAYLRENHYPVPQSAYDSDSPYQMADKLGELHMFENRKEEPAKQIMGKRVKNKNLLTDYEGRCGNCHNLLKDDDKYCRYCGTPKGKGKFLPYENIMVCIYGPEPVERHHLCPQCGYQWTNCVMIDEEQYCPKCGSGLTDNVRQQTQYTLTESYGDTARIVTKTLLILSGIRFLNGQIKDKMTEIPAGAVMNIGKDPKQVQILVDASFVNVSRLHCSIEYDAHYDKYFVTDYSLNGTYMEDGRRLQKGVRVPVEHEAIIYLANKNCQMKLL